MQLCSLSVAYACPYHNHPSTVGHSVRTLFTTPNTLASICLVQLKPGFIHEENSSPACQWPSKVSICPLKSGTMLNCSQVKILVRTTSTQMRCPEMVSDSLCRNSFVVQTHRFINCPSGWCPTIPQLKKLDVEVLGCRGYTWSAVVRPVGRIAKFSKTELEKLYFSAYGTFLGSLI